ncbi:DUF4097 family beta strand repeat-containing protein [Streptomyces sp. NPDC085479]|uniref:DUF4097 family beta strand repeat-containing protein n=1 Tax=Streptomyces sp. NPDC085479 TaxID=3365726 RepID=UPI0037D04727
MFDPSDIARLTDADRDQIAADFVAKYGISEATAARAVHLVLTLSASLPAAQAGAEYEKAVTRAFTDGEAWAAEFTTALFAQALPGYRATHQAALADGRDPAAALAHEHGLGTAAVAEILAILTGQTPPTPTPSPAPAETMASSGRSFTADVTSRSGRVTVTVDPAATVPTATVRTTDTTGPAADAAARATVALDGDRLTVRVPDTEHQSFTQVTTNRNSDVTVSQYIGVVTGSITGLVINGDGTMLTNSASSPIEVHVTLPPRSAFRLTSHNASLRVNGRLDSLRVRTHNGDTHTDGAIGTVKVDSTNGSVHLTGPVGTLRARTHNGTISSLGTVERAEIETQNGSCHLPAVTETLRAQSHNGPLTIDAYSGTDGRLTTHNGRITLTATGSATGRITASTHNGAITLRGVDNRPGLRVRTNTHRGTVRTT